MFLRLVLAVALVAMVAPCQPMGLDTNDFGCLKGDMFYSSAGDCCSKDMAMAQRIDDKLVNVTCVTSISFPLGEEDSIPPHLDGIRRCFKGDMHDCPLGTRISSEAQQRQPLLDTSGCCTHYLETRDENNVCWRNSVNFSNWTSSEVFWAARLRDGCLRKGPLGWCCEDLKEFRDRHGACVRSAVSSGLQRDLTAAQLRQLRNFDGCGEF
ncbi:hypothetical protein GQ602_002389 [Ophiocordyceps camponoti-floridani]|uniref:Uncharacterized protein n=1 Tax=Ophiocordyceps camponoti-floridani TaxID=2030778 RepID=A0A8H4VF87_9HYPO|nr:hypothetical protein GQ602_002389 [Ophiocordyceps camponoti-floridani]